MTTELFKELVGLFITVVGIALTYFLVPYLKAKTTQKQREDAIYWIKLACKIAEDLPIFKDKGLGLEKKEWVLDYLEDKNVKLTGDELDKLIDDVVDVFNEKGWNVLIN